MSHEIFGPYRPNNKAAGVIARARSIIEEYQAEGACVEGSDPEHRQELKKEDE